MRDIVLIVHNVRSAHNVGSLLRTADGLGIVHVFFTGYTPYPLQSNDSRLPHLARKIDIAIHKTALGAEQTVEWTHIETIEQCLQPLRDTGYTIAAVEQTPSAVRLPDYAPPQRIALVVGREVEGIEAEVLAQCEEVLEIPMFGRKESFNVSIAAAIALYHCRFTPER
jgi:23S rRNA (guanosine2251-2'-O)-methyltransferase